MLLSPYENLTWTPFRTFTHLHKSPPMSFFYPLIQHIYIKKMLTMSWALPRAGATMESQGHGFCHHGTYNPGWAWTPGEQLKSWRKRYRVSRKYGGRWEWPRPIWRKDSCFVNKVLLKHSQAHSCVLHQRPLPSHKSRAERFWKRLDGSLQEKFLPTYGQERKTCFCNACLNLI